MFGRGSNDLIELHSNGRKRGEQTLAITNNDLRLDMSFFFSLPPLSSLSSAGLNLIPSIL